MHNDYQLAPEKLEIRHNILSNYCCSTANKYDIWWCEQTISKFRQKKIKYVLHYRNLKLYLLLGMKLVGVYWILKFKQHDWLKKYINFDAEKKENTTNSFKKDSFKLMNATFGKTM